MTNVPQDEPRLQPHAFHLNLPKHHIDDDGIPYVSKFSQFKARKILELAHSIQLKASLYCNFDQADLEQLDENMDDYDEDEEEMDDHALPTEYTLISITKKCSRLSSQLMTLENLKHCGISSREMCEMVLHIFRLVTATVTYEYDESNQRKSATLHYQNVGYIWNSKDEPYQAPKDAKQLEEELRYSFALPSPAREPLLSVLISILSKKTYLRGVSNSALFTNQDDGKERFMLILHWQPLLQMLLRTAPYLDEHKWSLPPKDSNSRQSTILKRSVHFVRLARHFFDQGVRPTSGDACTDVTSVNIWNMVKEDLLHSRHTHAFYRGLIMMYLLHPTRCTSSYYLERMPIWYNLWTNLDRCPEIDYIWLVMFCRARKHMSPHDYDWGPIRKRLLTHCQYWLQVPIGGASMDSSFPRAGNPRSRSCPSRLKAFVGSGSSYEEGIDFVAKVTKLLALNIGVNFPGQDVGVVSAGTTDMLKLLYFVTPYFHPSNIGSWTFTLGAFLHYFCYEICHRVGVHASMEALKETNPGVAGALLTAEPSLQHIVIPPDELVALMDALLPLCQQALYSKNSHVGRAGEAALVYLAQVDAVHVTPSFLDFALQALDISAVNSAHQAPSALSALMRLLQPALRRQPSILLSRLPELLRLSLAGIDSNDQNKTTRTLILYRNMASWISIGSIGNKAELSDAVAAMELSDDSQGILKFGKNVAEHIKKVTQSEAYLDAVKSLPESSLMTQQSMLDGEDSNDELLIDEANSAMADWVLGFLDRIFDLLRAAGEREKSGKAGSGVAVRHSSSDVQQARNFSRILKECVWQVFSAMDDDIYQQALRSLTSFIGNETLPSAAKDASALCQAACAVRSVAKTGGNKSGLDMLVPVLTDDLGQQSNKTLIYRIRCLAGAVRSAGKDGYIHREAIVGAITIALSSKDKLVLKCGCKLLRHTLASQSEAYPIISAFAPRCKSGTTIALGKSAELAGDSLVWHVPDGKQVDFVHDILQEHVVQPIADLKTDSVGDNEAAIETTKMRRCLRIIRYALRGGSAILLDMDNAMASEKVIIPQEQAVENLIRTASSESQEGLRKMRKQLCAFVVAMSSLIASETVDSETDLNGATDTAAQQNYLARASSDTKICKEVTELSMLLLTRRGAQFRCQEGKSIWKAQKQLVLDFAVAVQADHMSNALQRAAAYSSPEIVPYKDGEDGGKTIPRRLLATRIQLFYESIQRNSSFEIPRKLRRLQAKNTIATKKLFSADTSTEVILQTIDNVFDTAAFRSLDAYEGLLDGLFALSCHSNTQVRAAGIGIVDYAVTRFGWLVRSRVPRLLAALTLKDEDMKGKFGIPSACQLSKQLDSQGKRRRMAEVLKGVCSILSVSRTVKEVMTSEKSRLSFIQTVCETDSVIAILPTEEMQKMVHYYQSVFNPFRSKFYSLMRTTVTERAIHDETVTYLLGMLNNDDNDKNGQNDDNGTVPHWRRRLLVAWFLTFYTDSENLRANPDGLANQLWELCFDLLEREVGQPLQRLALGLLGRLVSLSVTDLPDEFCDLLRANLQKESFCKTLSNALVYDHREDASIGGGHDAQWSTGVEDLIRDAARNVAPKYFFPFTRTGLSSGVFKVSHAQLVEEIIRTTTSVDDAKTTTKFLLENAKLLAAAPPSEDQRNQQVTSAEIFAGATRALLSVSENKNAVWEELMLPYLEDIIPKIPISIGSAYFDSVRYAIQQLSSTAYFSLVTWIVNKIETTAWQSNGADADSMEADEAQSGVGAEGFTLQSKYLYLVNALLIEMDSINNGSDVAKPWYETHLTSSPVEASSASNTSDSWLLIRDKLLPLLLSAVGHPYENCRDHVAACLFRIYNHDKRYRSSSGSSEVSMVRNSIVERLSTAGNESTTESPKERYNSLITTRKFFSYSIYLGDAKGEFTDIILPLLPMAFEALQTTVDEEGVEDVDPAIRALEAEVFKGYRYTIAELSVSCVLSYGDQQVLSQVLETVKAAAKHKFWQVRQGAAHYLRCFEGCHKFLFSDAQATTTRNIIASLLSDERREVSSAAMSALTGILAATPDNTVASLVDRYVGIANRSRIKKKKAKGAADVEESITEADKSAKEEKERKRSRNQQTSVFFLCAVILAEPYDTPPYIPVAIAAVSRHSFEKSAPLGVRDIVKKCCGEFKRTHMSDNWELHRKVFDQEQLEALEDVVSTPHYYA